MTRMNWERVRRENEARRRKASSAGGGGGGRRRKQRKAKSADQVLDTQRRAVAIVAGYTGDEAYMLRHQASLAADPNWLPSRAVAEGLVKKFHADGTPKEFATDEERVRIYRVASQHYEHSFARQMCKIIERNWSMTKAQADKFMEIALERGWLDPPDVPTEIDRSAA